MIAIIKCLLFNYIVLRVLFMEISTTSAMEQGGNNDLQTPFLSSATERGEEAERVVIQKDEIEAISQQLAAKKEEIKAATLAWDEASVACQTAFVAVEKKKQEINQAQKELAIAEKEAARLRQIAQQRGQAIEKLTREQMALLSQKVDAQGKKAGVQDDECLIC